MIQRIPLRQVARLIWYAALVVSLTAALVAASGISGDAHDGEDSHGHFAEPLTYQVESIADAQPLVPFEIKSLNWSTGHEVAAVIVEIVQVGTGPDPKVSVDILLRTPDGLLAWHHQTNFGTVAWGWEPQDRERLVEWEQQEIGGNPATVATSRAGTGYVHWQSAGVIHELQYPQTSGTELVSLALSVID